MKTPVPLKTIREAILSLSREFPFLAWVTRIALIIPVRASVFVPNEEYPKYKKSYLKLRKLFPNMTAREAQIIARGYFNDGRNMSDLEMQTTVYCFRMRELSKCFQKIHAAYKKAL
jgi:hypothetical protein